MDYYSLVAEFCVYPKTEDTTLDFFNFLEEKYPKIWHNLNMKYADDESIMDCSPRMSLYGWDDIAEPGSFGLFLSGFKTIFHLLAELSHGECDMCKQNKTLAIEHSVIVSWNFAPMIKYYEAMEMDGSVMLERLICRECAIGMYQKLVDKANPEKVECWA